MEPPGNVALMIVTPLQSKIVPARLLHEVERYGDYSIGEIQ